MYLYISVFLFGWLIYQWVSSALISFQNFSFIYLTFSVLISNSFSSVFSNLCIDFSYFTRYKVRFSLISIQLPPPSFLPLFSSSVLSDNDLINQTARQAIMRAGVLISAKRGLFQIITLYTLDLKQFVIWVSFKAARWPNYRLYLWTLLSSGLLWCPWPTHCVLQLHLISSSFSLTLPPQGAWPLDSQRENTSLEMNVHCFNEKH